MIVPFPAKSRAVVERMKDSFARAVLEVFPEHHIDDLAYAILSGMRALERGESIMGAMHLAEQIVTDARSGRDDVRDILLRQRNCRRLAWYRIKRAQLGGTTR